MAANSVSPSQAGRQGLLVERTGNPLAPETFRHLGPIAKRAIDRRADASRTTIHGFDPGPVKKRWPMSHMLTVQARQLSDPVVLLILMKAFNSSQHGDLPHGPS